MLDLLRKLSRGWLRFARKLRPIGLAMTFLMMNVVFVFLLPFALIRFWDPLRLQRNGRDTHWLERKQDEPTIERFKHPF